ncbi:hypothetical protein AAFF_G00143240 [Aldrovandia affinis]|uniref:Integrase catalytic domain-containing protein n=1 Tax=Aldrovandia affinis TaxID=143900 RepID=A0AAD7T1D6_9TELE|nr:hypothetical protein AAFF_G00143240 [Aldrovandia affinis]
MILKSTRQSLVDGLEVPPTQWSVPACLARSLRRNGNRYCLTATDFFTKWVEAIPIQDKTAAATSQALMDIFHTHGAPEVILTDQGREFWNKVNQILFEKWGAKHHLCLPSPDQRTG